MALAMQGQHLVLFMLANLPDPDVPDKLLEICLQEEEADAALWLPAAELRKVFGQGREPGAARSLPP
eukprot:1840353-Amphidinium_carterae.1